MNTAIGNAESGSTIYLENGVYVGENNLEINIDKNITIQGKGKNVVIDGQNKYNYLFQMGIQDPVTKKLTPVSVNLINLKIIQIKDKVIDNWGTLKVNNCTFSRNKISDVIIANYKSSNCKITNSVFTKNTFTYTDETAGIAIYNDKVTSFSISQSTFSNFKSTNNSIGVVIQNYGGSNTLINKCKFNNIGKGTVIFNADGINFRVMNSRFTNNKGWAIDNFGSVTISKSIFKNSLSISIRNVKKMKITDSTFSDNTGKFNVEGYENAGVIENQGTLDINKSTFKNNRGKTGGVITNIGSVKINHSIFIANTGKYGGAIHNGMPLNSGILKVVNSIFKNNIAGKTFIAIFNEKKSKVIKSKVKFTPKEGTKVKK